MTGRSGLRLNRNVTFDTDTVSQDLSGKTLRGGMTTMATQATLFVLRTAGTAVLARMLTPDDYGLIGMAVVVVNFAAMFKDAGLSMATIQRREITHDQVSALFWVNTLVSLLAGAVVWLASPVVASFYRRPELAGITAALSLSIIIGGLSVQHQALLRRHMMFKTIALTQIAAQLGNLLVSVVLARLGAGYWALVGGTLVSAVTGTVLMRAFCDWTPGKVRPGSGVRSMLSLGGYLTGHNVFDFFTRYMDNVLIGRFVGAEALGYYGKAYALMLQPLAQLTPPVGAVATPLLCRLADSPDQYRRTYKRLLNGLTMLTVPLVVFLAVYASDVVYLLLGEKWLDVVPIFTVLAIASLYQPATYTTGWLYISQARTKDQFKLGLFTGGATVLSFVVGLPWGALGVATAYVIIGVLQIPFIVHVATRTGPVSTKDFYLALASPFGLGVILAVALRLLLVATATASPFCRLAVGAAATVAITGLILYASPQGRSSAGLLIRAVRARV